MSKIHPAESMMVNECDIATLIDVLCDRTHSIVIAYIVDADNDGTGETKAVRSGCRATLLGLASLLQAKCLQCLTEAAKQDEGEDDDE
jgi:hypothetical protein